MNQFTQKVNIPLDLSNINFVEYKQHNKKQIRCDNSILGEEIHSWFKEHGIEIQWLEIFCLKPFERHVIHSDGHEIDSKGKLNYIHGGKGSTMSWYAAPEEKIIKGISKANTRYLMVEDRDAVELYKTEMQGFNLVKVGPLHTVKNKAEDRYCLSMALADFKNKKRLDYDEICNYLKEYIDV